MLVTNVLLASDSLWGTDKVRDISDEDLHILVGAAVRIMLECNGEQGRRRDHSGVGCDSVFALQDPLQREAFDYALSLLHLADVPGVPSVV